MGKVIGSILGTTSKPKASTAPVQETEENKRSAQASRAALFETEGGVAGQELDPNSVEKRNTLLGN